MSGHSKWATIRRAKGKTDAARGRLFTKIGREIAVAVKMGGPDVNSNSRLRDAVAKAKSNNMPNDNIQRSIKKASGELNSINYEEITYEGYGVGGSAVIVKCLTDNKNRSAGDVRHAFDKMGGSMGSSGCVSYLFDKKGILELLKTPNMVEDEIIMMCLETNADDVIDDGDEYEIITSPANFNSVRDALTSKGLTFENAEITMVPQTVITLKPEQLNTFLKMVDLLEELDDVQEVYHNVNIPEMDNEDE